MTEPERATGGGGADLAAVFDAHVRHEFVHRDVQATMATMAAEP